VDDTDEDPAPRADEISRNWIDGFGATPIATKVEGVRRCFEGKALVRVRATVAHDSYERLVEVECQPGEHKAHAVRSGLYKLSDIIENAQHLGIDTDRLVDAAGRDPGIAEFCRFYIERRVQEVAAAGDDARKRRKLEDDFTPRLLLTAVALEGTIHREVTTEAQYKFEDSRPYASRLTVVPRTGAECGRLRMDRGRFITNATQQIIGVLDGADRHLIAGGAGQRRAQAPHRERLSGRTCFGPPGPGSTVTPPRAQTRQIGPFRKNSSIAMVLKFASSCVTRRCTGRSSRATCLGHWTRPRPKTSTFPVMIWSCRKRR
jgi:hypothetical protein